MDSICNFIPQKKHPGALYYYHFVYETNIKRFAQPLVHSNYYLYLVFKGTAVLKTNGGSFPLKSGTLFFAVPEQSLRFEDCEDFTFLYISFNGEGASDLLLSLGINKSNFLFEDFGHVIEFWMNSIRRVGMANATILTESVFMYTLSFLNENKNASLAKKSDNFEIILDYLRHNYTSKDMSIKKIADIFFYSEKYLSSLFIRRTGQKFTHHLNSIRIDYALRLINDGVTSISDVSARCGFSDQFYFSKVFKKITGFSPTAYIKEKI